MDLTLNLGNNREEFIEKLATYRYYALNEDLIKGKEVEKFLNLSGTCQLMICRRNTKI